ncbi:MAG: carboxypeptidase-like regulatory domain-containing protein [Bacteroidetes bacterium]|nr:carboxypeptidase-like regulatory domain-containing protein [Bacteroidota bacterium]MDA1121795.1 carboxypeptidase-like regulatory domain-containing protein [Bacteroidota bacterium]
MAQTSITGKVTDKKGEAIPGANVYLEHTYDGGTSALNGSFGFETEETGSHALVVSFIGYLTSSQEIELNGDPVYLQFPLAEEINKMDGVTITAGAFEASDQKKGVVLKPLDIATTAGATADIPGALNTLPGTQKVGESGRLFVRGGTGEETNVFMDRMLVHNFHTPSAPNTPGRSRFSPFLFKGTMFTTGGYSAEYGQALSSTLVLNSLDLPDQTESNISLMTVGTDVSHTQLWDNSSVFGQIAYTNLNPYVGLVDQSYDIEKGFTSVDGILSYRRKMKDGGMVKLFGNFNTSKFRFNTRSSDST